MPPMPMEDVLAASILYKKKDAQDKVVEAVKQVRQEEKEKEAEEQVEEVDNEMMVDEEYSLDL